MTFRDATIDDLPAIVDIYNSTIPSRLVTADTEPITVGSRIEWFHTHEPKERPLWIAEENGNTLGWISFRSFYGRPAYKGTAEIGIYLHENARGKGFGKLILAESLHRAPALDIHTVLGFIFAHNTVSLQLFQQAGFTEWGHLPDVAVIDGNKISLKILGIKTS